MSEPDGSRLLRTRIAYAVIALTFLVWAGYIARNFSSHRRQLDSAVDKELKQDDAIRAKLQEVPALKSVPRSEP